MSQPSHSFESSVHPGRVILCDGDRFSVAVEGRDLIARRAASCLLAPEPGDRVLVALLPEAYVVAVVERASGRPAELSFEGDAAVRASGRLTFEGGEGVAIRTPATAAITAGELEVRAGRAGFVVKTLELVAKTGTAHLEALSTVAKTLDVVATAITERAERIHRFVDELDQLRARHVDHRAGETLQIVAGTASFVARGVARVDGDQVHIG